MLIESVLIANRGEIARRIMRTAARLGVRTIAVYSDADAEAPFVREADEAVHIGGAAARDSYLCVDRIVAAAVRTGAAAIHPGYGFLSEKPELARACRDAGIVFVGPDADVIEAMGSKIGAKRIAMAAGVPVVPGFEDDDGDDRALIEAAGSVGFPLLVKASSGGGGKGMRPVERAEDLPAAIEAARREAKSAFGDDRLLLERLVRRARHIEVQVAADGHGNVVHLFERDCSVQRNNQKVFEEAPAPDLRPGIRAALLEDSVRLARSIGYRNLGTMEFLFDTATGEYFFMEMNTRLQVEHPVTEAVLGLDLVELQLRIAGGEPLGFGQDELAVIGHAVEARLLAERPEAGYAPATGRIELWRDGAGVRVDTGVETGSEVTVHYDSMIAKVIAHGADRDEALRKLARGLSSQVVLGIETNRSFLIETATAGPFAQGTATTACLGELYPDGWTRPSLAPERTAAIAAGLSAWRGMTRAAERSASPWNRLAGFRLMARAGRPAIQEYAVLLDGQEVSARIRIDGGRLSMELDHDWTELDVAPAGDHLRFRIGGESRQGLAVIDGERVAFRFGEAEVMAEVRDALTAHVASASAGTAGDRIVTTMPGVIAEVKVAPGDRVAKGDPVLVIESMKLFMTIASPRDGVVAAVHAQPGANVPAHFRLIDFEPEPEAEESAGTPVAAQG